MIVLVNVHGKGLSWGQLVFEVICGITILSDDSFSQKGIGQEQICVSLEKQRKVLIDDLNLSYLILMKDKAEYKETTKDNPEQAKCDQFLHKDPFTSLILCVMYRSLRTIYLLLIILWLCVLACKPIILLYLFIIFTFLLVFRLRWRRPYIFGILSILLFWWLSPWCRRFQWLFYFWFFLFLREVGKYFSLFSECHQSNFL